MGALVGLTGVGGGSLMTPFLLPCGIPPSVAVGADLAYAVPLTATAGLGRSRSAASIAAASSGAPSASCPARISGLERA